MKGLLAPVCIWGLVVADAITLLLPELQADDDDDNNDDDNDGNDGKWKHQRQGNVSLTMTTTIMVAQKQ